MVLELERQKLELKRHFRHKQRNPMDVWHSSANKCACEYLRSYYPAVGTTVNEAEVLGIGHTHQRAARACGVRC